MEYSFRDLGIVNDEISSHTPQEFIIFGSFDSRSYKWWLSNRDAPTPNEQEIVETVPYMQGQYDFSEINGERYFENREITYTFKMFKEAYSNRKTFEQEIKRMIMPQGIQQLYDSHDEIYYWLGKCKSISVTDDDEYNTLSATLIFNCYPFAIRNNYDSDDIWDEVYFDHWYFQDTEFTVKSEEREVIIRNIGSSSVQVDLVVNGMVKINDIEYTQGTYQQSTIVMNTGDNKVKLSGNGTSGGR